MCGIPFHHLLCRDVNSPSAYVVLAVWYRQSDSWPVVVSRSLLLHFTPLLSNSPRKSAPLVPSFSELPATSRYCCVLAVMASAPPTCNGPCFASSIQTLRPSWRARSADRRPVGPAIKLLVWNSSCIGAAVSSSYEPTTSRSKTYHL
jgi:hypothetical protein